MFGGNKKRGFRVLTLVMAAVLIIGGVVSGTFAWLIADTDPVVNTFSYGDIDLKLEETKTDVKGNPVDEDGNLIVDQDGDGVPDNTPAKTPAGNDYAMIPGEDYLKDPKVTVLAGNEACWLFVKLEEIDGVTTDASGSQITHDFNNYLSYDVILADSTAGTEGWTQLLDETGVAKEGIYFRYVGEDTDNTEVTYDVLENNTISVKGTVTKEMLNALDNNGEDKDGDGKPDALVNYPKLSITAYAVQYSGFEATDSTAEQMNAAALDAWKAVEGQAANS